MSALKDQLLNAAMKLMQSETARQVMSNERFQQAMAVAFRTTFRVRNGIDNTKKRIAESMNFATREELRELRRNLERLERRLKKAEAEREKLLAAQAAAAAAADA
jgi:hypothetical protein